MPFILHILKEDAALWEEIDHGERWNYRLIQRVYKPELDAIKVSSPARLDMLIGKDVFCRIGIEEGYLSKNTGAKSRTHFSLKYLDERELREPVRRLRLAIESIDSSKQPPRVILKEWKP